MLYNVIALTPKTRGEVSLRRNHKKGDGNVRKALHKIADIICVLLELAFAVISLPFKLIKALLDIADSLSR